MDAIDFPSALTIAHAPFWLDAVSASQGAGLDGREQIVISETSTWVAEMHLPELTLEQSMVANAFGDRLGGRARAFRVPVPNFGTPVSSGNYGDFLDALGVSEAEQAAGAIAFSDGAFFSDGSGFALPADEEPKVVASVAVGAKQVSLSGYLGELLQVGAVFSCPSDYLYRVWENEGGLVSFSPPLRASLDAGDAVQVSRPMVRVRLANDRGWRLFQRYARTGRPMKVEIVEALDR
jgi:hypothetical protein